MSIPVIRAKGSPHEMGVAQGRAVKDMIHELADERMRLTLLEMELSGVQPDESYCLKLANEMLSIQEKWNLFVHEEFMGIAEGASIDPARLLIGNGYTDFKDVVAKEPSDQVTECTSLFVLPGATQTNRTYAGQTWDMHASAEPYIVIVEREPMDGPRTLSLTTTGCLSLIGINEWGLAIGTNNLTPDDSRPGVHYLALIHAALQAPDFDSAVRTITEAPRASGHHYYLATSDHQAVGIETTATKYRMHQAEEGIYGYANHYLDQELALAKDPLPNTVARQQVVTQLLEGHRGQIDPERLKHIFQDRTTLPNSICRYGDEPIEAQDPRRALSRTCAAAVLDPASLGFWAVWGPPDRGQWQWYGLE